jgi:hypothetical protein
MTMHLTQALRRGSLAVSLAASLAASLGLIVASAGWAQSMPNQPQFRDPKTGQVWTPQNVGLQSGPNTPADRAFNPQGQTASIPGVVAQTPSATLLGSVPITAGPTVPIANLDNASLSVIPGQGWQIVLYLNNNSAGTINPVINCQFTNSGNPVEATRASLPPVGPGQRVGLTINGSPSNLFVDGSNCQLASPS